jgi:hypothetical protein
MHPVHRRRLVYWHAALLLRWLWLLLHVRLLRGRWRLGRALRHSELLLVLLLLLLGLLALGLPHLLPLLLLA